MKVLVVEPLKECYTKETNGLEEMQALVGGYIQAVYPFEDPVAVVCNEEGKNLGLSFNRPLLDEHGLPTTSSVAPFLWLAWARRTLSP